MGKKLFKHSSLTDKKGEFIKRLSFSKLIGKQLII